MSLAQKNTIRVMFVNGCWFDFVEPEGVNFAMMIRSIRADHFFCCDQFYIPENMILAILRAPADVLNSTMVIQRPTTPNAPTTETPQ